MFDRPTKEFLAACVLVSLIVVGLICTVVGIVVELSRLMLGRG